jgi:hypothetical protein
LPEFRYARRDFTYTPLIPFSGEARYMSTMPQVNIESDEIDLKPVEDITEFSDTEQVPVEHVNF